jgi:SAM-dependent methyltransferase
MTPSLIAIALGVIALDALRRLFAAWPGADNVWALNARSPGRDAGFLVRLFDRVLVGCPPGGAVVCDIGGAGQITQAADPGGRIGTVIEVNDPAAVPGAIPEAAFHALPRTDLDLVTMFGVAVYLDEAQLARYFTSARSKLRPGGWLVIGDPEYRSGLERSLRSVAIGWLLAARIDFKPLCQVAPVAEHCGFRLAERQVHAGDWYVAMFRAA